MSISAYLFFKGNCAEAMKFYRLFYHYELSAQEAAGLLARSR